MNEKPSPTVEFDIKKWGEDHVAEVTEAGSLLNGSKALVIEGPVHSGKTSLAWAVAKEMQNTDPETLVVTTTPAVQEVFTSTEVKDRTGVIQKRLPPISSLQKERSVIIILDEISNRGPQAEWKSSWRNYAGLNNVKVMFLSHSANKYLKEWVGILSEGDEIKKYTLEK
ncbi:hypothetical protein COV24_00710 [candidate division WWE3 bacterium CG10_big_fil_rev_8_21_14_0_10_32_10]|uniref:ATPase AAA-type core domain-containing protein n=1 Tax=candidate division WWE3 bacterium CG10_big_fil_rev_8_21_14_0_10_32_10 TaxID=1975090 RepID=A0A2H0RBB6_UNCKA|nr:MAG: hypothetical protein COV24_00710 [candidate division WWE3 bacterium CG10_big_fil_rev_8_21_14_0_10_32_10]